ncbi:hypothetical protein D3C76_1309690 [compost metagenome]
MVVGAGADQHPQAGVVDQQPHAQGDQQAGGDEQQAADRVHQAGQHFDEGVVPVRRGHGRRAAAEEQGDQFIGEEHHGQRRQHLVQVVAVVEPADDGGFDHQAIEGGTGQGGQAAEPEGATGDGGVGGAEGADHVEGAVGQVDHAHDAENQGQA